ncbi:hypothetical protein HanIR_Chr11g0550201 [Helianthus annuus]|nr:hypothetical protein HanIR_Chr11g0550201 [Helianthus annuus]
MHKSDLNPRSHTIQLSRARPGNYPKPIQIIPSHTSMHHLHRTACQTEHHGPDRYTPRTFEITNSVVLNKPVGDAVDGGPGREYDAR